MSGMDFEALARAMTNFIKGNPTAFHTVRSLERIMDAENFERLTEGEKWKLSAGKSYYVSRNGSSLIAFRIGCNVRKPGFQIIASHTDSPTFKLKEKAVVPSGGQYSRLNVEPYGGMICYSWFDRPLSIAGRVLVRNDEGITSKLVNIDRDLLLIPSVAIHMQRKVNEGLAINQQVDMLPLLGADLDNDALMALIAREAGVPADRIVGSDLYLYCRSKASIWGAHDEYVSSARLDDQQCVFASFEGFLRGRCEETVAVFAAFDNEEVGSGTKQGAESTFLPDVLKRISSAMGLDEEEYMASLASSFMISADNAHAVHPNHPELSDESNRVYMNEGVVVKSNAAQKYTSDGMSKADLRQLSERADVPLQYFSNRSDMAGGSTLGNLAMAGASMMCVDIGLPQLAMHSSYETAGVRDTEYLIRLAGEFYSSHIGLSADGESLLVT